MSRIFIKLVEVVSGQWNQKKCISLYLIFRPFKAACLSCVIAKAVTDQEAKRTFILNQKLSR